MREMRYNRNAVVSYAHRWALDRNPDYYNFEKIGGDCTNFASQCIYAGANIMNYTPVTGWYYRTASDRTASWTGVEYLYKFLINNQSVGPYGHVCTKAEVMVGDIVQLGNSAGIFYHSPVIIKTSPQILIAAHTYDAIYKPLTAYNYAKLRFIHIDGVRMW